MSPINSGVRRRPAFLAGVCLFLAPLALLNCALPALADRDIVYSARYYLPPGSTGESHFHLYRINPDGSGRIQITFGSHDDQHPLWSPDDRWIVFERDDELDVVRPDGSSLHQILARFSPRPNHDSGWYGYTWSPDSHAVAATHTVDDGKGYDSGAIYLIDIGSGQFQRIPGEGTFCWSPDGKGGYIETPDDKQQMVELHNDRVVAKAAHVFDHIPLVGTGMGWPSCVWIGDDHLAALGSKTTNKAAYLILFGANGRLLRTVECQWPGDGTDPFNIEDGDQGQEIDPGAPSKRYVIYGHDIGDASDRPDNAYYLADLRTGAMEKVVEGQFVVFAPDGVRYCTADAPDVTSYGLKRVVYTAPLEVGALGEGDPDEIVSGLVWVTGADWRKR